MNDYEKAVMGAMVNVTVYHVYEILSASKLSYDVLSKTLITLQVKGKIFCENSGQLPRKRRYKLAISGPITYGLGLSLVI